MKLLKAKSIGPGTNYITFEVELEGQVVELSGVFDVKEGRARFEMSVETEEYLKTMLTSLVALKLVTL